MNDFFLELFGLQKLNFENLLKSSVIGSYYTYKYMLYFCIRLLLQTVHNHAIPHIHVSVMSISEHNSSK